MIIFSDSRDMILNSRDPSRSLKHFRKNPEFAYNNSLPMMMVFRRSWQNSYVLHVLYKFGYIVTLLTVMHFVDPCRIICSFIKAVASFLHSLKFKNGCETATQTFYVRKVKQSSGDSFEP